MMVESLRNITSHFNMLLLVAAHRDLGCLEYQNVGRHQYRIAVQRHRDALVRVFVIAVDVRLHRGFIGVCAVHQAFSRHAGEDPR